MGVGGTVQSSQAPGTEMCKSGGTGNVEKTISNKANQDDIEDIDNGFSLVNIHLNTLIGTSATLVIVFVVFACFCVVCAKPMLRTWRLFHEWCRAGEGFDRRLADGGRGMEMSVYQAATQGHLGAQARMVVRPVMGSVTGQDSFPSGFPVYGQHNRSVPLSDQYPVTTGPSCESYTQPSGGVDERGGGGVGMGKRSPM